VGASEGSPQGVYLRRSPVKYYWMVFDCLTKYGYTKHETVSTDHPFKCYDWAEQFGRPMLLAWKEITREEFLLHPDGEE